MNNELDELEKKECLKRDERIKLDTESEAIIANLKEKIKIKFNGLVKVSSTYLGNFIIHQNGGDFTDEQWAQVKDDRLSDLQKAEWICESLRKAHKDGKNVSLEELLNTLTPIGKIKKKKKEGSKKLLINQSVETRFSSDDAALDLADEREA